MKITDIEVDSFGHWKGLQIPGISPRITVIHGPNEAGKSTILHLIRAVLYGFQVRYHARFLPPRHPGHVGGKLSVATANGKYLVRRWLPDAATLQSDQTGDVSVQALSGGLQGKHLLPTLLAGVDDAIFRNVFAVGLSEMQQLGTLSDTEAAHQLYGLAAGADRVSIADVSRQLAEARAQQVDGRGHSSIRQLTEQRDQLRAELLHDQSLAPRWLKLFEEQQQVNTEIDQLEQQRRRFSPELAQANSRQQLREQWKACRRNHQKYVAMGTLPEIPADVIQKLDATAKQIREHRQAWVKQRQKRRLLRDQARQLSGHPPLMHYGDQIQQLHQRANWLAGLVTQVEKLRTQAEETEFELMAELERLGLKTQWRVDSLPLISDEVIADLKEPAREAREAREQGEAAERVEREGQATVEKLQRQLANTLQEVGQPDLTTALQRMQKQAELLRQRMQAQGKIDALERKLKQVRADHSQSAEQQLLPWRGLMMLGALFSLGVLLLLSGLFGGVFNHTHDQRWSVGFVGAALSLVALGLKGLLEFAAGRNADACRGELASLHKQLARLMDDVRQLEPLLPPGTEPYAVRLQRSEDEWRRLSDLQPLENQRLAALERVVRAQQDKEQSAQRHRAARDTWRQKLRQVGLPEGMSPQQFRQFTQSDSPIGKLRLSAVEAQQQLKQKQQELKDHQERIQTIFERASLVVDSDRDDEQVEQLHRAWQKTRESQQERESLHRKWREAAREQEKLAREAKRLNERRQQLVTKYGVGDAQELKAIVKRREEAMKLRRQRDQQLRQIATQLGSICDLGQLRKDLERNQFEQRLKAWESEHDVATARLAKLLEQRGELNQQLKTVTSQRQLQQKRLQLGEIEAQLRRQCQDWQALAATSLVLDTVRKAYESDRQPGTLAEASGYLKQLTDGKYQRIWTPFGESTLCVDDQNGRAIQVEHLSRGTREQVYLSLRLALAAAYSRRGSALPLILDDVFVNFDAQRALHAAETICEFAASGHQVLVFTCHDHIRDVFHRLGVDLRELPNAQRIAEHPEPVLPCRDLPAPVPPAVLPLEVEPLASAPLAAGLPSDGDPELDHELLYGAPEYDPGYGLPRPAVADDRSQRRRRTTPRRRRPRRPSAPQPPDDYLPVPEPPREASWRPAPRRETNLELVPYDSIYS